MKRCSTCLDRKDISEFGINRAAKDGRMNRCRTCNTKATTQYYEKKSGTKLERETLQNELHNQIKSLRLQGYKLKDIAKTVGLDTSTISLYLAGKRKVGSNAVRKYKSL